MKKIFLVLTLLVSFIMNMAFMSLTMAAPSNTTPAKQMAIQSTASVLDYANILTSQEKAELEKKNS